MNEFQKELLDRLLKSEHISSDLKELIEKSISSLNKKDDEEKLVTLLRILNSYINLKEFKSNYWEHEIKFLFVIFLIDALMSFENRRGKDGFYKFLKDNLSEEVWDTLIANIRLWNKKHEEIYPFIPLCFQPLEKEDYIDKNITNLIEKAPCFNCSMFDKCNKEFFVKDNKFKSRKDHLKKVISYILYELRNFFVHELKIKRIQTVINKDERMYLTESIVDYVYIRDKDIKNFLYSRGFSSAKVGNHDVFIYTTNETLSEEILLNQFTEDILINFLNKLVKSDEDAKV